MSLVQEFSFYITIDVAILALAWEHKFYFSTKITFQCQDIGLAIAILAIAVNLL